MCKRGLSLPWKPYMTGGEEGGGELRGEGKEGGGGQGRRRRNVFQRRLRFQKSVAILGVTKPGEMVY